MYMIIVQGTWKFQQKAMCRRTGSFCTLWEWNEHRSANHIAIFSTHSAWTKVWTTLWVCYKECELVPSISPVTSAAVVRYMLSWMASDMRKENIPLFSPDLWQLDSLRWKLCGGTAMRSVTLDLEPFSLPYDFVACVIRLCEYLFMLCFCF